MTSDPVERAHLTTEARRATQHTLDRALDTLNSHWEAARAATPDTDHNHTSRPQPGSRPPIPIQPVSVLDAAYRDLRSWGQVVIEGRGTTTGPVARHKTDCPRHCDDNHAPTGPDIARWLGAHTEWLAAHEAGPDAADELNGHASLVRRLAEGVRVRRARVGSCPEIIGTDDAGIAVVCSGDLWAELRAGEDLLPDRVMCDAGCREWSPSEWLGLGRRIGTITEQAETA